MIVRDRSRVYPDVISYLSAIQFEIVCKDTINKKIKNIENF